MFNFLNNIQIEENAPEVKVTKGGNGPVKQERNPSNGAHLRLFKDGKVYPSLALIDRFNLEYTDIATKGGNGFDITDSRKWTNTAKNPNAVLFISAVAKSSPKVDLFGSCTYYKTGDDIPEGKKAGDAKSSVVDQGPVTFGKQLIVMLREVYNLDVTTSTDEEGNEVSEDNLFGKSNFVDLFIAEDHGVTLPDGIYWLPKTITKGDNKGQQDVQRRENITMYPLVVFKEEYVTNEITTAHEVTEEESVSSEFTSDVEDVNYADVQ
jgi:hypothetical protein